MTIRVSVVGATGYSGAELCALLARHREVSWAGLYGSGKGAPVRFGEIHPSLRGRKGPDVGALSLGRVVEDRPDVAFLATPNELSAEIAAPLLDAGIRVIDLSGAFRLADPADYPAWYGFVHPSPQLLGEAVYGLTEHAGDSLAGARLVANPGCYPTSVLLALRPLVPFLDPAMPVICDSKSGVSGAGKKAELAYSFTELSGNFKAYGVGTHRHSPEMRRYSGLGETTPFVFVPHLLPVARGILSTLHVTFASPASSSALAAACDAAYRGAPFVGVNASRLPELKDVVGTPRAEIGFAVLPGGRQGVAVSVIDNLLKGAASQAVQNLNRVFGFPETEGLTWD